MPTLALPSSPAPVNRSDPQSVALYFHPRKGTFGFAPVKGARALTGHQAVTVAGREAFEAFGFDVYIFDSRERWVGFMDGLALLHERDDDIGFQSAMIHGGLWAVVVHSDDWDHAPEAWTVFSSTAT